MFELSMEAVCVLTLIISALNTLNINKLKDIAKKNTSRIGVLEIENGKQDPGR